MPSLPDLAIGSYEAAAIAGVHFTRPKRMMDRGEIEGKLLDACVKAPTRRLAVYSLASCDKNFHEYQDTINAAGGRPRVYADDRKDALKRLAAVTPAITYNDAIGYADAAKIIGCHLTLIPYLVGRGHIVARRPWNKRSPGAKVYIVSKKSAQAYAKKYAAEKAAGNKRMLPQKKKKRHSS